MMNNSQVFDKLNLKDENPVAILNAPEDFTEDVDKISTSTKLISEIPDMVNVQFILVFVYAKKEIEHYLNAIHSFLEADVKLWIAYPKGSSKKYKADFNRDNGFKVLGTYGYEAVRQVAIDEDWSALRFRKIEYIKSLKRDPKRKLT